MSSSQLTDTVNCWTIRVGANPSTRSGTVWVRDNRNGQLTQTDTRWMGDRWYYYPPNLGCPAYVQQRVKSLLGKLPKGMRPAEVSQGDLARLHPGSVVRLELGDILLRVSGVHHGGLLLSGTRTDNGKPMRVRFDAVDEIVSAAS